MMSERARFTDLLKANTEISSLHNQITSLRAQLAKREAQAVQREREAAKVVLQFYANETNWLNIYSESGMRWPMVEDGGKKARALLATYNDNSKG
jgi:tryptophan 2,3-dioxygenase